VAAGDFETPAMKRMVEQYLGPWQVAEGQPAVAPPIPNPPVPPQAITAQQVTAAALTSCGYRCSPTSRMVTLSHPLQVDHLAEP
jgi:predicted Zn-dependent peptidase